MSYITWQTPAGNLGIIPHSESFEKALVATDSSSSPINYRLLSGVLPPGMQIVPNGAIQGVPNINTDIVGKTITYKFVVRAGTTAGAVADRTFDITISGVMAPILKPAAQNLGNIFDGIRYRFQFSASNSTFSGLEYTINKGSVPLGLTLSSTGLLSGIPILQYNNTLLTRIRSYTFSVKVSDGINFDIKEYSIAVVAKSLFSADDGVERVDIGDLDVSHDNHYPPVLITPGGSIGNVRQNDNFNYKFEAIDAEGSTVYYTLTTAEDTEWGGTIQVEIGFDLQDVGFDSTLFDQGAESLPGIKLNYITGWMSGTVNTIDSTSKEYNFKVTPYKFQVRQNLPTILVYGDPVYYTLTVQGDLYNTITWQTPANLGTLADGKSSTLQVVATSTLKDSVAYSLANGYPQQLPQGVRLTTDGLLIGRPSFRRFGVDGDTTVLAVADSAGVVTGMDVTGPGVGTGAKVVEVISSTEIVVGPAVIAAAGTAITFYNNTKTVVLVLTEPGRTTTITDYTDGADVTTFDAVREFTVRASTIDGTRSSVRTFTVTIDNYNLAPFDNLYLKALPKVEQRTYIKSILNDASIFPEDLIYRPADPWFGKSKDIKTLLLPGIVPSTPSEYISSMIRNHYNKKITFGTIKTARAVDESFNTKYEVVYVELIDNKVNNSKSALKEQIDLSLLITNYFNNDPAYRYLYPNGFKNMGNRVGGSLGFENRGALPDWMTSPQTDGRVVGFVNAAVLAYTVPNGANVIKYRLEQSGFNFNTIDFVADRYQLDAVLSDNYDKLNNKFLTSAETTFDEIPRAGNVIGGVDFAVSIAFNQINQRSVNYINTVWGGIDGYTNIEEGMTLIFAQQEQFYRNTAPFDGWIRNLDSFGSSGFDSSALDRYEAIPGYLDVQSELSEVNQRAGIWTIHIDANNVVTLEFTREIRLSNELRVNNGASYSGSVLIYDPVIPNGFSVPAYRAVTRNNNDSINRTTFDGNGTKFLNYRDVYTNPEIGDKYLKFPQIGVFT